MVPPVVEVATEVVVVSLFTPDHLASICGLIIPQTDHTSQGHTTLDTLTEDPLDVSLLITYASNHVLIPQTTIDDMMIDEMRGPDTTTDGTRGPGTMTEGMSDPGTTIDHDTTTDESESGMDLSLRGSLEEAS